ncbi:uncharacterized protein LOC105692512 isoform X2 [Athalia rosae]|uniref:uncharacterized protein LOC105692512 isoform X2 n=1 Tax=Athalia rosae TaxID=37344 RepID=UPI002034375E|nr:uncharacterized protein LOC105692512 isoform X2 [Athalia rosae]
METILSASNDDSSYKINDNGQLQCQDILDLNEHTVQDNSVNNVNNYAVLPAVNLCPITWGIANLEIVETVPSGFFEVGPVVANSAPISTTRIKKKPRPYSPSKINLTSKKSSNDRCKQKSKVIKAQKIYSSNDTYIDKRSGLPFSCDKCKSPHIVDPTRCSPGNRKRPPMPRKHVDPINGQILLLCNACGIAAKTNRKDRLVKATQESGLLQELKNQYITESMKSAQKIAQECNQPELAALYCPSFSSKGCGCIEKYLSSDSESSSHERQLKALNLLNYHRKAGELNSKQNFQNSGKEDYTLHSENELHVDECEDNLIEDFAKPHYKCKSRNFEKFVLTTRLKLRTEYALCEKATKKILMYSNNFLHKASKTSPHRGSRIDKTIKRMSRQKPISDMHKEHCCGSRCTRIASSHATLLQDWRKRASISQKEARRVIAEMLTPTGGSKANCYRFIKMVTGCCVATIFLVNNHMKKTKGNREPPEHGLKKYFRHNSKSHKKSSVDSNTEIIPLATEIALIPSDEELLSMGIEAASNLLQEKKQQLEYLQNKLLQAETRVKAVAEATVPAETLVSDYQQDVQNNLFVLGPDGVIRPWKGDPSYVQIATEENT